MKQKMWNVIAFYLVFDALNLVYQINYLGSFYVLFPGEKKCCNNDQDCFKSPFVVELSCAIYMLGLICYMWNMIFNLLFVQVFMYSSLFEVILFVLHCDTCTKSSGIYMYCSESYCIHWGRGNENKHILDQVSFCKAMREGVKKS